MYVGRGKGDAVGWPRFGHGRSDIKCLLLHAVLTCCFTGAWKKAHDLPNMKNDPAEQKKTNSKYGKFNQETQKAGPKSTMLFRRARRVWTPAARGVC